MSAAPNLLAAFIRFIAYVPISVIPVLTWSVFTAVAFSLYFYYKPMAMDYIVTPIVAAFIIYTAYKRDGWPGSAGAALGILLIPVLSWAGILADASNIFWDLLVYLVEALWNFVMGWALIVFAAGVLAGLAPFISIIFGLVAGLFTGLAISGVSMYILFVTNSIKRFMHRITFRLPPGAMALIALPTASLVMAIEVALAILIMSLVGVFVAGYLIGSAIGLAFMWFMAPANGTAYLIGLVLSQFWHRIEGDAFSPAAWLATALAYAAGAGTPAMLMAAATATLLTPRYGKSAYTWMAVALSVHAFYAWLHVV
jgi:hypothetical protein